MGGKRIGPLSSQWVDYCVMVAEVSKHNAEFIMKKMPYARGLQFRTAWWQLKQIECESFGVEEYLLKVVMD